LMYRKPLFALEYCVFETGIGQITPSPSSSFFALSITVPLWKTNRRR